MNIKVPRIDGRTRFADGPHDIIDLDTGKKVGTIECRQGLWLSNRRYFSRNVSLFDNKYQGNFETHGECVAFAKGVEAVITQMVAPKDAPPPKAYYEFAVVQPSA